MAKRLQDMSLEELWELFPIILEEHNPNWKEWANEEIDSLHGLLSDFNPIIHHVGSTAIPNIKAKPIVDILVEVPRTYPWQHVKNRMESQGYICMGETPKRVSFNKGYTTDGYAERVFHIHFCRPGDNEEIAFRDYLISHPNIAQEYEKLKMSLLPKYRNNRDGYTHAKTDFIIRVSNLMR